jgi:hypothetical protein
LTKTEMLRCGEFSSRQLNGDHHSVLHVYRLQENSWTDAR